MKKKNFKLKMSVLDFGQKKKKIQPIYIRLTLVFAHECFHRRHCSLGSDEC